MHVRLAVKFRHFVAAAGCIWQLTNGWVDNTLDDRIRAGMDQMKAARGGIPIFRFVAISRMDATTLFAGDVQPHKTKGGNKTVRVLYKNHAEQIEGRVVDLRVLNVESHMQTTAQALAWTCDLAKQDALPPPPEDVVPSALASALSLYSAHGLQSRNMAADSEVATGTLDDARPALFRRLGRRRRDPASPPETPLGNDIISQTDTVLLRHLLYTL